MTEEELEELRRQSTTNNQNRGVSAILIYASGCFLQVLEGILVNLKVLFEKISEDPRHKDIRLLFFKRATSRIFPAWSFGAFGLDRHKQLEFEYLDEILRCFESSGLEGLDHSLVMSLIAEFRSQLLPDNELA